MVAITPTTTILIDNQPGQATSLQTGEAVSLRVKETGGSYSANQVSAQSP